MPEIYWIVERQEFSQIGRDPGPWVAFGSCYESEMQGRRMLAVFRGDHANMRRRHPESTKVAKFRLIRVMRQVVENAEP